MTTKGLSKQHVYPLYQSDIQACVTETKWHFYGGKGEHIWCQNMGINGMFSQKQKGYLEKERMCNTNIVLRMAVIYIFEILPPLAH